MEKEKSYERFFDDVIKTVQDGLNKLVNKTDQLTQIGRIKIDILSVKREIERQFTDLGGRVYQLAVEKKAANVIKDAEVQGYFEKIKALQEKLERKKEDLARVSKSQNAAGGESDDDSPDPEYAEAGAKP